jgi:hypothetical protein
MMQNTGSEPMPSVFGSTRMKIIGLIATMLAALALVVPSAMAQPSEKRAWLPKTSSGTPVKAKRMIIRERGERPRWGYIGPHYKSEYGPGYHDNGPGIGIER